MVVLNITIIVKDQLDGVRERDRGDKYINGFRLPEKKKGRWT